MTWTRSQTWHRYSAAMCALLIALVVSLGCAPSDSGDGSGGPPVAAFTQDSTGGTPGTVIQFTDESTGGVTSWSWDFGYGGLSSEQNPSITFAEAGTYTVWLRVSGPNGTSRVDKTDLITIGDVPTAGFDCSETGLVGYAPFTISCTDASAGADSWAWDFGDSFGADTASITHTYTTADTYTLSQTASNSAGSDTETMEVVIHPLGITADPGTTGPVPYVVTFSPDDPAGLMRVFNWYVDGEHLGAGTTFVHRFHEKRPHEVQLVAYVAIGSSTTGEAFTTIVGEFGAPEAMFGADVTAGNGPLVVAFDDLSAGDLVKWDWTFGDGERCIYPFPAGEDETDTYYECDSSEPTHVYSETGSYDVSLEVTGPTTDGGSDEEKDPVDEVDFVRVYIGDPGFENQSLSGPIGAPWVSLRPIDETESADHVTLSATSGSGPDLGMPTESNRWAVLEGLGTDGQTAVADVENGIRQDFLLPPSNPVLEFDFVLLYAEPPLSPLLDAVVATVSDGATTVPVPSSQADPRTPYAGPSDRYPTRDPDWVPGTPVLTDMVRGTPVLTASLNVAETFPAATADTRFTLTIRTTNDQNGQRSPLVYVDDVRFARSRIEIIPVFETEAGPFRVGVPVEFDNTLCDEDEEEGEVCPDGASWRWDFDTHGASVPPDATGSGEPSPAYAFAERGVYDVTLEAHRADAEGTTTVPITVYDVVEAGFDIVTPEPRLAGDDVVFEDTSIADQDETFTGWSWDFGGWGTSDLEDPGPINFPTAGSYTITLTVTTDEGGTSTVQQVITILSEPPPPEVP